MIRKAFTMSVYPGKEEEYTQRHNPIWKELADLFKERKVSNYSIFLEPKTGRLFGYAEIEDEAQWDSIAQTAICQKWWKSMSHLMPSQEDHRPISEPLREVFHLD